MSTKMYWPMMSLWHAHWFWTEPSASNKSTSKRSHSMRTHLVSLHRRHSMDLQVSNQAKWRRIFPGFPPTPLQKNRKLLDTAGRLPALTCTPMKSCHQRAATSDKTTFQPQMLYLFRACFLSVFPTSIMPLHFATVRRLPESTWFVPLQNLSLKSKRASMITKYTRYKQRKNIKSHIFLDTTCRIQQFRSSLQKCQRCTEQVPHWCPRTCLKLSKANC